MLKLASRLPLLIAAIFISSATAAASPVANAAGPELASVEHACEREIVLAAERHAVPLPLLYGVGLTESGVGGRLDPFALNIAGRSHVGLSFEEAIAQVEAARAAGEWQVDVGCMQINLHYHLRAFPSVAAVLDPQQNVDYAARFLKRLLAREGNWTTALARYHASPRRPDAQRRYVCRVLGHMVRLGFAAETARVRSHCGG